MLHLMRFMSMRKCIKTDRGKVIDIIAEAFDVNPSVNRVIRNDAKRKKRIRALADYSFQTALLRNGAYLSSDARGVALCYQYNLKKEGLTDYLNQIKLIRRAIGFTRVMDIMKRDGYLKSQRPADGNYLYFWFLGITTEGKGGLAIRELKEHLFAESARKNLPIYLETSVPKNKRVYERYGFETYHEWTDPKTGDVIWLMRRFPK